MKGSLSPDRVIEGLSSEGRLIITGDKYLI